MCVDGTLSDGAVASTSQARGCVFAKTGTFLEKDQMNGRLILTAKSLAGYVLTARGHTLCFAIFMRDTPLKSYDEIEQLHARHQRFAMFLQVRVNK